MQHKTLLTIALLSVLLSAVHSFKVVAFYDEDEGDAAHNDFNREALDWFPQQAQSHGFEFDSSNDFGNLNADYLSDVQVVLFLNARPWDWEPQQAFIDYVNNGGGWMGFHATAYADDSQEWDWFSNDFLGCGKFETNTWWPTSMTAKIENQDQSLVQGLPDTITSPVSEWYSWEHDLTQNSDIKILWSIDQSSFPVGTDPDQSWYDGYYPICWTNTNYHMMYCNFGHNYMDYSTNTRQSSTFSEDTVNNFVLNALSVLSGGR